MGDFSMGSNDDDDDDDDDKSFYSDSNPSDLETGENKSSDASDTDPSDLQTQICVLITCIIALVIMNVVFLVKFFDDDGDAG
jgi:hypothetical protein